MFLKTKTTTTTNQLSNQLINSHKSINNKSNQSKETKQRRKTKQNKNRINKELN